MLESLVSPEVAEKRPYEMFFLAIAIGSVATALAVIISRAEQTGYLAVAFASLAAAPLMVRVIELEEEEEAREIKKSFLERHADVLEIYGYYFLGIIIAVSMIYTLLPGNWGNQIYNAQTEELQIIQGLRVTGKLVSECNFFCIFENNVGVLALILLFSFALGAGAIYIITWNASIVGVLIGSIAKANAINTGQNILISYLIALPYSLISLFPHGIFEISAYFLGGLAGGMLSAAMLRGHLFKWTIFRDILTMFLLSVLFVAIGAVIEVGV